MERGHRVIAVVAPGLVIEAERVAASQAEIRIGGCVMPRVARDDGKAARQGIVSVGKFITGPKSWHDFPVIPAVELVQEPAGPTDG